MYIRCVCLLIEMTFTLVTCNVMIRLVQRVPGQMGKCKFDPARRSRKTRPFEALALTLFELAMMAIICILSSASGHAQQTMPNSPTVVQPGAPGSPSKQLPPSTSAVVPQRSQADIEFMQGMIMHHGQAVEMTAFISSRTENKEIRALGARISLSQADEMKFMKRWLVARGEPISMSMPSMPDMNKDGDAMLMPGMLTPEQMDALRQAKGAEFDRKFLTGMIQHHNGALVMVKELFDTPGAGQDAELFDFATDVDNTQRAEIRIMENMLKEKR
jgi:uncharacterized protein (DUF305 family)